MSGKGMGAAIVGVCLCISTAVGTDRRMILKPQFDPDAERIELFAGIESGAISARVTPKDSRSGAIFLENLTDRPLTVEMPAALVGVHVLPQDGFADMAGPVGQGNRNQSQPVGTGFPTGTGPRVGNVNRNNAVGPGPAFFSIPPERVARIGYQSVCLAYGQNEPRPGNTYRLVRPEEFSKDAALHELLKRIGAGGLDSNAAQAAAWHIANDMSWPELAALKHNALSGPDRPMFTRSHLMVAERIVAEARSRAADAVSEARTSPAGRSGGD
jgi:hypothetical protein